MPAEIKKLTSLLQSEDGSVSKLQSWERQAIMLHLEGWPASQIAIAVNKNPGTVRKTLKKEATQKVLQDYESFISQEYESLYSMAVQAIRDALDPAQAPLSLRTETAKFFLNKKSGTKKNEDDESAETIVQRIVNVYNDNRSISDSSSQSNHVPIPPKENE
jgi:IS30 family transposase